MRYLSIPLFLILLAYACYGVGAGAQGYQSLPLHPSQNTGESP